ncbi:MAG: hypothetical protein JXA46_04855 [Dehalococcoidales bacterium]|nr:hypothetical protein [Dehalococcoidales bacterium]
MSLDDWLSEKLITPCKVSPGQIAELLHISDRDLEKVKIKELGPDWRLSIAHNAALQAAAAALAAAGYRARSQGQHYIILQSLAFTLNLSPAVIKRLDKFRQKRNLSDYERAGAVTEHESQEMVSLAKKLRADVEQWLRNYHPELTVEL